MKKDLLIVQGKDVKDYLIKKGFKEDETRFCFAGGDKLKKAIEEFYKNNPSIELK